MRSRGWYTKAYATPQNARLGGGSRGSRGASNPKVGRLPRNLHEELSPRLDKDRNRSDHARNKHDEAEYSEPGLRVIDVVRRPNQPQRQLGTRRPAERSGPRIDFVVFESPK